MLLEKESIMMLGKKQEISPLIYDNEKINYI